MSHILPNRESYVSSDSETVIYIGGSEDSEMDRDFSEEIESSDEFAPIEFNVKKRIPSRELNQQPTLKKVEEPPSRPRSAPAKFNWIQKFKWEDNVESDTEDVGGAGIGGNGVAGNFDSAENVGIDGNGAIARNVAFAESKPVARTVADIENVDGNEDEVNAKLLPIREVNLTSELSSEIPPERGFWQGMRFFVRNFFSRRSLPSLQGLIYNSIFLGLFALCCTLGILGIYHILTDEHPNRRMNNGLNPSLVCFPFGKDRARVWYNTNEKYSVLKWVTYLDNFMNPYVNQNVNLTKKCKSHKDTSMNKPCYINLKEFGPCSPNFSYGYGSSSPCLFLKLNKVYNWLPEVYNDTQNLPKEMPDDLQEHIKSLERNPNAEDDLNQIWVSCKPHTQIDNDHLPYGFEYYPRRGFPSYFYPCINRIDYLSPLVAVRIIKPKPGVTAEVECRVWAKNIKYSNNRNERSGFVVFQINIDY